MRRIAKRVVIGAGLLLMNPCTVTAGDSEQTVATFTRSGEYRFLVDEADELVFRYMTSEGSDGAWFLVDPKNRRIDPSRLNNDPTVSFQTIQIPTHGVQHFFSHSVTVKAPPSGSWTLNFNHEVFKPEFLIRGSSCSLATPAARWAHPGDSLRAEVKLPCDGQPVRGAKVTGLARGAPSEGSDGMGKDALVFVDDGTRGDEHADDGVYTASVTFDQSGGYGFDVRATDQSRHLERLGVIGFKISRQGARLTGRVQEVHGDRDSDGKFEFLHMKVEVEVTDPEGEYLVCGTLLDHTGGQVWRAHPSAGQERDWSVENLQCASHMMFWGPTVVARVPQELGRHQLNLSFLGDWFVQTQQDGPYRLWLNVEDVAVRDNAFDRSVHTTTASHWNEFENAP